MNRLVCSLERSSKSIGDIQHYCIRHLKKQTKGSCLQKFWTLKQFETEICTVIRNLLNVYRVQISQDVNEIFCVGFPTFLEA